MKKFLLGVAVGAVFTALTLVILTLALVRLGERRPEIAQGSTLVLDLAGEIPELPPAELPLPGKAAHSPLTVQELWALLHAASADNRVRAILLRPSGLQAGWGKLDELRAGLKRFRKSGKPVYAYLRHPGAREYYLAAAADKVYFAPEEVLDLKGLRVELLYLKGTMDKLGAKLEVEHAGKYKDAADMFVRDSMSPETREVMNSLLDALFTQLTGAIAEARGKSPEQVRALIDRGPFTARAANESGLVDGLKYPDEVEQELASKLGQASLRKVGQREYLRASRTSGARNRIAFLVGEGPIYQGSSADWLGQEVGIGSTSFIRLLRQVRDNQAIRGVILRIDSPGGDATASDEILREVKLLSRKKPTVISFSDVAASGGYYIAASGDDVMAYAGTLTGSIGVIYGKLNLRGLYEKLGMRKEILKRGASAAADSDYEELGPEGRRRLKEIIDAFYDGFLTRVASARKKSKEEVHEVAQGRVWLGIQAREKGLVDRIGGLDEAVELLKKKAGIPEDQPVQIIAYPGRKTLLERLLEQPAPAAGQWTSMLPGELGETMRRWLTPDLLVGGVLARMPYEVVVR